MSIYTKLKHVRISDSMESGIETIRVKLEKKLKRPVKESEAIRKLLSKSIKDILKT